MFACMTQLMVTGPLCASCMRVQFEFGKAMKPRSAHPTRDRLVTKAADMLFAVRAPRHTTHQLLRDMCDDTHVVLARSSLLPQVKGYLPHKVVAATLVFEGTKSQVRRQQSEVYAVGRQFGGFAAGSSNGRRGYMMTYMIGGCRTHLGFGCSAIWCRVSLRPTLPLFPSVLTRFRPAFPRGGGLFRDICCLESSRACETVLCFGGGAGVLVFVNPVGARQSYVCVVRTCTLLLPVRS